MKRAVVESEWIRIEYDTEAECYGIFLTWHTMAPEDGNVTSFGLGPAEMRELGGMLIRAEQRMAKRRPRGGAAGKGGK